MRLSFRFGWCVLVVCIVLSTGCPSIAPYNLRSYELTTAAKAEALEVVSQAVEPYGDHVNDIESLRLTVEKAYEFANGIPRNDEAVSMWMEIKGWVYDSATQRWRAIDNGSLYPTLALWQRNGSLSAHAVEEKKKQIARSFDQLIELESGKNKN